MISSEVENLQKIERLLIVQDHWDRNIILPSKQSSKVQPSHLIQSSSANGLSPHQQQQFIFQQLIRGNLKTTGDQEPQIKNLQSQPNGTALYSKQISSASTNSVNNATTIQTQVQEILNKFQKGKSSSSQRGTQQPQQMSNKQSQKRINDEIKLMSKAVDMGHLTNLNIITDHYNVPQTAKAPARVFGGFQQNNQKSAVTLTRASDNQLLNESLNILNKSNQSMERHLSQGRQKHTFLTPQRNKMSGVGKKPKVDPKEFSPTNFFQDSLKRIQSNEQNSLKGTNKNDDLMNFLINLEYQRLKNQQMKQQLAMKRPNSTNKRGGGVHDNLLQNLYKGESKSFVSGRRNSRQGTNRRTPPKKQTHRALVQKSKPTTKDISFTGKHYNPQNLQTIQSSKLPSKKGKLALQETFPEKNYIKLQQNQLKNILSASNKVLNSNNQATSKSKERNQIFNMPGQICSARNRELRGEQKILNKDKKQCQPVNQTHRGEYFDAKRVLNQILANQVQQVHSGDKGKIVKNKGKAHQENHIEGEGQSLKTKKSKEKLTKKEDFQIDSTLLYGSFNKDQQQQIVKDKDSIDYIAASEESKFETFGELEGKNKVTAVSELQSPSDRTPSSQYYSKSKIQNITVKNSAKKDDLTYYDFDPYQNKSVQQNEFHYSGSFGMPNNRILPNPHMSVHQANNPSFSLHQNETIYEIQEEPSNSFTIIDQNGTGSKQPRNQNFFLQCESLDDEESKYYSVEDDDEDKESYVIYDPKSRNKERETQSKTQYEDSRTKKNTLQIMDNITVEAVKKKLINDPEYRKDLINRVLPQFEQLNGHISKELKQYLKQEDTSSLLQQRYLKQVSNQQNEDAAKAILNQINKSLSKYNKQGQKQQQNQKKEQVDFDFDEEVERNTVIENECENDYQDLYQSISESIQSGQEQLRSFDNRHQNNKAKQSKQNQDRNPNKFYQ